MAQTRPSLKCNKLGQCFPDSQCRRFVINENSAFKKNAKVYRISNGVILESLWHKLSPYYEHMVAFSLPRKNEVKEL